MSTRTNDASLRSALKARLARRHRDETNVVIVEELPAGRASTRIDLAVLNGHLHGFEIKSDLDTLERLPRQVASFGASMQQMTLVVGQRHVDAALGVVPDWWGVTTATLTATGLVRFKVRRGGRRNPRLDPRSLAELLERDELLAVLRRHRADRGVRTAGYAAVVERMISCVPLHALVDEVREELKFRAAWEASYDDTAFGRNAVLLNVPERLLNLSPASSCAGSF